MAVLPRRLSSVIRCTACNAQVTYRYDVTQTHTTRGSCTLHIKPVPDDLAWLVLFDQAHTGPLVTGQ